MLSDLVTLIGLAKEIRKMVVKPADGISFSIVTVEKAQNLYLGDHLRIINLLPVAICAVKFWLQHGENERTRIPINHVYHSSRSEEPFGHRVIYRIPISQTGVFLYPQGMYYVPLSEYPNFDWTGEVRAKFNYLIAGQREKEGNLQIAARAEVVESTLPHSEAEPK